MIRPSLSRSCFLALIAILLFVSFTAFFGSIPRSSISPSDLARAKDAALKGASVQAGGPAPAPEVISEQQKHVRPPTEEERKKLEEEKKKQEEEERKKKEEEEAKKKKEEEERKANEEERDPEHDSEAFTGEYPGRMKPFKIFDVPKDIVYDPAGPRPDQIVLLTASDGKGHNGGIENLIEQTRENRLEYTNLHGYKYLFINITKYDLGKAHPVWAKLPAISEAFDTFPDAQWVWWLDLDAIIMTPSVDLSSYLLSHKALEERLQKDTPIHTANRDTTVRTPKNPDVKNIDLIITQDLNGPNAGSFFMRRSEWSRFFLDIWSEPMFVERNWQGQEQDAMLRLIRRHSTVIEHVGVVDQRVINAYPVGHDWMGWHEGDVAVHLAGCWVDNVCQSRWQQYMGLKSPAPKPGEIKSEETKPEEKKPEEKKPEEKKPEEKKPEEKKPEEIKQ